MSDSNAYIRSLILADPLQKRALRSAVQTLGLPVDSRGLDAGCGIGLQMQLLAEAIGPAGHVTGLDISAELLAHAEERVKKSGMSGTFSFRQGDVRDMPFDDGTFDWVWSSSCAGYAPMEPVPLLKELGRVVKPGGLVAIIAWSSETLLPGRPVLEARLGATSSGIAPFGRGRAPQHHFLRALGWFHETGMIDPRAGVFADCVFAPLEDGVRAALVSLFESRWKNVASELSPEDLAEYERLCLETSPDFILDLPDYYALFTYSMFWGRVPG